MRRVVGVARRRDRDQEVAGLADRGPGEQAYGAVRTAGVLAQGRDIADGHGQRGEDGQGRAPDVRVRGEALDRDEDQAGEADGLADHGEVARDGERRADVGVRHPEVERGGGGLEGEADEGERDTGARQGGQPRVGQGGEGVRHLGEVQAAGGRVQEAHTEQHHGGGGHRGQEELERGLGGEAVPAPQSDQREGGQRGDFEGDDEGGEVPGGGQQGRAGGRGEQQEPVLAAGQVVVLEGVDRQQGGQQRPAEHQELDDQGERVGHITAHVRVGGEAEGAAVVAQEGQQEQRGEREARRRDPPQQRLAGHREEEVGDEHHQGDGRGDGGRREGEPVDGLDQRGDRAHHLPPPRSCWTAGSVRPRRAAGHSPARTVRTARGAQAAYS